MVVVRLRAALALNCFGVEYGSDDEHYVFVNATRFVRTPWCSRAAHSTVTAVVLFNTPHPPRASVPPWASDAQVATLIQGIYTDFDELEDAEAETAAR